MGRYGPIQHFTDIQAWNIGREIRKRVYAIVKRLPKEEQYSLGSQMRRVAVSVTANIAEGYGRYHTKMLLLLIGLSLIRGLIYSTVTPPWQAPDEPHHFHYAEIILQKHRLPKWGEDNAPNTPLAQAIHSSMIKFGFYDPGRVPAMLPTRRMAGDQHPPFYHLLSALFAAPVSLQDITLQLYALRLFSVLLGTSVVLTAFVIAKELFPEELFLVIGIPLFILFLPMHTFISSSVNNENLATLTSSLLIYALIKGFKDGFSPWRIFQTFAFLIMGLLTKSTTFFTIPLVLAAIPIYLWGRALRISSMRRKALLTACLLGLGAGLGAWHLGRVGLPQVMLDDSLARFTNYLVRYVYYTRSIPQVVTLALREQHPYSLGFWQNSFNYVLMSFWAKFGWVHVNIGLVWYEILKIISFAAFCGLAIFAVKALTKRSSQWRSLQPWRKKGLFLLFLAALLMLIQISGVIMLTAGPGIANQGRYLFPAIIPIATLFMLGLWELVPAKFHKPWLLFWIGAFFVFDSVCLLYYIIPYWYG